MSGTVGDRDRCEAANADRKEVKRMQTHVIVEFLAIVVILALGGA